MHAMVLIHIDRYQAAAKAEGLSSDDWPPPARQDLDDVADKHEKNVHRAFHRITEAVAALHAFNSLPVAKLKEQYVAFHSLEQSQLIMLCVEESLAP